MAISTEFLTIDAQRLVAIASVTSEVSGQDVEFAFDYNLNTWWEPTSTATQYIILDLQAVQAISGIGLFIRNHETNLSNGDVATVIVYYSDTGTSGPWTQYTDLEIDIGDDQTVGDPIIMLTSTSPETHRYWRLGFWLFDPVIQLAHVFLGEVNSIGVPDYYPIDHVIRFGTRMIAGPGGRTMRSPTNAKPINIRTRSWLSSNSNDMDALQAVVDNCGGRELFLMVKPNGETAEVVEILDRELISREVMSGIYAPTLRMRTVPYIIDGGVF